VVETAPANPATANAAVQTKSGSSDLCELFMVRPFLEVIKPYLFIRLSLLLRHALRSSRLKASGATFSTKNGLFQRKNDMLDSCAFRAAGGGRAVSDGPVGARPLVVIPTYDERENIASIVEAIHRNLPQATIWIVDDNSPDGTGHIADELAAKDPRVGVIHRAGKMGLGTAYVEAFQHALAQDFDVIIEMDADFSHDPAYLPGLMEALQDADFVLGSRYTEGGGTRNWSWMRQMISRGGNLVANIGLGVVTRDATGGFRAFRRTALEQLDLSELKLRGYGFQIEVVYQLERKGMRIKEVPIVFVERVNGRSKMSKGIVLEAVIHILRRRLGRLRRKKTRMERSPRSR
jgi:dolichol-phosphate mannosyltransferase